MDTALSQMTTTCTFKLLPITSEETLQRCKECAQAPLCLIASYPKSGTTWMQACVASILLDGTVDGHISGFSPFFEADATWKNHAAYAGNHSKMGVAAYNTHLLPDMVPSHDGVKIVYVMRSGRDVAMSFYHHLNNQVGDGGDFVGDLEAFLSRWGTEHLPYGGWTDHVNLWVDASRQPDRAGQILLVRYEDLVADLSGSLVLVAEFLGRKLSLDRASELASKLTFSSMKADLDRYQPTSVKWREGFSFLRKGESGTSFTETEEQLFQCRVVSAAGDKIETLREFKLI